MSDRVAAVLARIERARRALMGTGEADTVGQAGRSPARSDRYRRAQAELHSAMQERNRVLVDLVGDAEAVPLELAGRLGVTGREAQHVVDTARRGSRRMRGHVLGRL